MTGVFAWADLQARDKGGLSCFIVIIGFPHSSLAWVSDTAIGYGLSVGAGGRIVGIGDVTESIYVWLSI